MFTGLIEAVGTVESLTATAAGSRLTVAAPLAGELSAGESLAINGVCLTVVAAGGGSLQADVSPETLRVSSLGSLGPGALVNLERPLRAGARLGGHFVQGHVDATGTIERLRPDGESHWLTIAFPPGLAPYIVQKGSIAVDGISLTIAGLAGGQFDVQIIPFTFQQTNLRAARLKTVVNLECDILGKYVVRAVEFHREVESRTP